jgi:hypothetical protein
LDENRLALGNSNVGQESRLAEVRGTIQGWLFVPDKLLRRATGQQSKGKVFSLSPPFRLL